MHPGFLLIKAHNKPLRDYVLLNITLVRCAPNLGVFFLSILRPGSMFFLYGLIRSRFHFPWFKIVPSDMNNWIFNRNTYKQYDQLRINWFSRAFYVIKKTRVFFLQRNWTLTKGTFPCVLCSDDDPSTVGDLQNYQWIVAKIVRIVN